MKSKLIHFKCLECGKKSKKYQHDQMYFYGLKIQK